MPRRRLLCCLVVLALSSPAALSGQAGRSVLTLLPTDGRRLEMDATHRGALSTSDHLSPDDQYLEAWELQARAGQSVTLDLESDEFDPRLHVVGPGFARTLIADDGAGGCNARLTFTTLEDGPFTVVASSATARETGTYTLRAVSTPPPPPSYDCGEVNPERLRMLPTEGRRLELGSVATGTLTAASATVDEGRPVQAWSLEGRTGQRLSIVLTSEDFDAYLYLLGPGLDGVLSDDDGAGSLNSQIDVTLPGAGPFTVVAAALSSGATGSYTLSVSAPPDLAALPIEGRTLQLGRRVDGFFGSSDPLVIRGRRGQVWGFEGAAGQRVVVELSSDDFDTYLYLAGPGLLEPLEDDDGAGDLNSRLELTLPESGTYRIIVSSYSEAEGAFTLGVSRAERPL